MKNTTLVFLLCSAFLTACDKASDTSASGTMGEGETSLLDKASSLANDAKDAAKEVSEKAGDDLNNAIDSTVDAAKETTENMVDSAKQSVTDTVADVKEMSNNTVQKVTDTTDEVVAAVSTTTAAVDTKEGETLFKNNCYACHGAGIAGSPKLGDKAVWDARVAQGNAVLIEHAIKGFRGKEGYYMPPKGGAMHLSDDQIAQVVEYMVSMAQ